MEKRYAVGIDLGTTNSALALTSAGSEEIPEVLQVPQFASFQSVDREPVFPSALYLPLEQEAHGASARLPWEEDLFSGVAGRFAREHGALSPDRLVTSAKSWLGHPQIDPRQKVLPWGSELGERKISPFEASRRYLVHLRRALQHHLKERGDEGGLEGCETVLTVPASFDEVARELTFAAAAEAGWGEVVLLEEQQAAFYHWLAFAGEEWRKAVRPGDVVLVCDVGGGTADFSLVAVGEERGNLVLERISVGDHILLGGDNMDLALAYTLRAELEAKGQKLDARQFLFLLHACRAGKERLFEDPDLDEIPIAVPSRGAGLFAGTVSVLLRREALQSVLLDGFLPRTAAAEHPVRRPSGGLRELGLPYEADPALSRHLALFLARSAQNVRSSDSLAALVGDRESQAHGVSFLSPTAVLFNGGVFKADAVRQRILALLRGWSGAEVRELAGAHFDLAVAKGAAVYARRRLTGEGIRIRAGIARSYYIGLESTMPAVPGFMPPVRGVCVVPQGMEEGSEAPLPGREFGLVTGEPVEFRFFSSSIRAGDQVGDIVDDAEELEETARLEVTLPPLEEGEGALIPVRLKTLATEVGTLELWMHHEGSGRQWKLEFNVRGES
jgi:hypothetical protein